MTLADVVPADPACDDCGAPATMIVTDIREIEPQRDDKGQLWACWETVLNSRRAGCDEHPPKPPRYITDDDALKARVERAERFHKAYLKVMWPLWKEATDEI